MQEIIGYISKSRCNESHTDCMKYGVIHSKTHGDPNKHLTLMLNKNLLMYAFRISLNSFISHK